MGPRGPGELLLGRQEGNLLEGGSAPASEPMVHTSSSLRLLLRGTHSIELKLKNFTAAIAGNPKQGVLLCGSSCVTVPATARPLTTPAAS